MIFRFRTVWNTDISSLFRWSFQTCIIACSMFNQLSWLKKIILNSCVKNVPMKQVTIVLEKCFSKCLDGASNADRGNPVYSQDKSAPAWPIHTPSSTAPYIQNTKWCKEKYRMQKSLGYSPFPLLGLPSLLVLRLRFSASLNVFFLSTTNSSSPFYHSVIFQFLWGQDIQIQPLWPQLYNKSAAKAVR